MTDDLKSLAEAIRQLNAMQDADNDQRAVELYRAIFRNDVDINKLDFNYADHILGYVQFGVEKAEVDYKNYLRYLKMISPEAYLSHLDMFNEVIRSRDDENIEEDEE
jgi:hypothetical protein